MSQWKEEGPRIFEISSTFGIREVPNSFHTSEFQVVHKDDYDRVVAQVKTLSEQINEQEGYPGIAHDFETMKLENQKLKDALKEMRFFSSCPWCSDNSDIADKFQQKGPK